MKTIKHTVAAAGAPAWIILLALIFGLSSGRLTAQATAQEKTSLLWEISGNGLEKPSYLYGTIHLLCPTDLQVSPTLREKMAATQQLYLELDMDDPTLMQQMQQGMVMTDGSTVKKLLSEEKYKLVSEYFQKRTNLPLDQVGVIKPLFLSTMLLGTLLECEPASWEATLMQLAGEQEAEVKGLETAAEQFAAFDHLSYAEQAEMLYAYAADEARMKKDFAELVETYRQQDVNQLHTLIIDQSAEWNMDMGALLDTRNRNWIPVMEEQVRRQPTFFAVGAGHLGGEAGVIALLRERGFEVRPVGLK